MNATTSEERMMSTKCDCGHKRISHQGATPKNDGGNDCRKCDCPVYIPTTRKGRLTPDEVWDAAVADREFRFSRKITRYRIALEQIAAYPSEHPGNALTIIDGMTGIATAALKGE